MVEEAEKYKEEDEEQRGRMGARNNLESYVYGVQQACGEDKLQDKLSSEDKKEVMEACEEALAWMEEEERTKEEYEAKQKEVMRVAAPVMTRFYQQGGTQGLV